MFATMKPYAPPPPPGCAAAAAVGQSRSMSRNCSEHRVTDPLSLRREQLPRRSLLHLPDSVPGLFKLCYGPTIKHLPRDRRPTRPR